MPFELSEIKKLRKKLNLTQTQLARKANVSQSLIAKIESNKLDPSYSKAKKIFDTISNLNNESKLKAKDLMTNKIIFIKPEESINDTIKIMRKHAISQLPVIKKHVVGLVSETTILNNLDKKIIKDIMEEAPPIISEKTSEDIITSLLRFYPMLLVMEKGNLKGVITKSDLLRKLS